MPSDSVISVSSHAWLMMQNWRGRAAAGLVSGSVGAGRGPKKCLSSKLWNIRYVAAEICEQLRTVLRAMGNCLQTY